jgi:hypothetical protein
LYFEGSPPAEDPQGVMRWGEIPLYFYVPVFPWKSFFDGMDQENLKTQGGKGQIRKIQNNKKERMEEGKRRDFYNLEDPILVCSPLIGNTLWLPPSGEPTHMGTSPTT